MVRRNVNLPMLRVNTLEHMPLVWPPALSPLLPKVYFLRQVFVTLFLYRRASSSDHVHSMLHAVADCSWRSNFVSGPAVSGSEDGRPSQLQATATPGRGRQTAATPARGRPSATKSTTRPRLPSELTLRERLEQWLARRGKQLSSFK